MKCPCCGLIVVTCPKCSVAIRIEQEVPRLPQALGIFDCPICLQPYVVYRGKDDDAHAAAITRTSAPPRGQA